MGLLDQAIREHLELKRRSGADPSEVAREEREALTPVFPDEPGEPGEEMHELAQDGAELEQATEAQAVPWEDHRQPGAIAADVSAVGQETAELDMQAVMEEDPDAADGGSPMGPIAAGSAQAAHDQATHTEDSLEWWGDSGEPGDALQRETRAQERLSFE
ncbi:MAG TPA: hypothetical protein VG013_14070 [Gemmataceae bacterium]|nr:hypothetical protein [Gemmataceae bacterium]